MHQSHMQQPAQTSLANFSHDGRIGLIEIDNPPVNALSVPLVQALIAALNDFEAVAGLEALVLYGAGRTWVAGADIATFDDPGFPVAEFKAFLTRLDAQQCHVVAALHGAVLGGGLELAMACHHRVAQPNTRLGLPEVTFGIVPGAQGTQRLPRLVGAELALDMITSGRALDATQAQAAGLALCGKGLVAVDGGDVVCIGHAAVGMARQQHTQLFKTLANGGDGLGEVQVALRGAAVDGGVRGRGGIERVDAAAGEHIGARRKAGRARAPGHEDFEPAVVRCIAQQQHGGGRAGGNGFAVEVQLLGGAGHA